MNNNLKEAIKLLNTGSSDSESSEPEIHFAIAPPPTVQARKKIRTKRKPRRNGSNDHSPDDSPMPCSLATAVKTAAIVFTVCGTLILGWLVLTLHSEVKNLSSKLETSTSVSQNPTVLELRDALRDLGENQSHIYHCLKNHSEIISDIRKQIASVVDEVKEISNGLKEAPQMLNIGRELESVKTSLSTYKASMSDLELSLNELKSAKSARDVELLVSNLNNTLWSSIRSAAEDARNNHATITELGALVQNLTLQLASRSNLVQRVDTIQTQLVHMEGQQRNTSATVQAVLDILAAPDRDGIKTTN